MNSFSRQLIRFAAAAAALSFFQASSAAQLATHCFGYDCVADAPAPVAPAGWTITNSSLKQGKGYGYITEVIHVTKTCEPCKNCKVTVGYSYSGSGDWTITAGPADSGTSCGQETCLSGSGPTSGAIVLRAECNGQDNMWLESDGQLGMAVLVCPCAN